MLRKLLTEPLDILKSHKKAFLFLNIAFYGVFVLTLMVTLYMPELHEQAWARAEAQLESGIGSTAIDAYHVNQNLMLAVGLTFLVNLLIGAFITMTLPSLLIPFLGILMAFYRAVEWGFLFAPVNGFAGSILSPHGLTVIIEGQAYVLAAFAIYVQGKMFLQPSNYGFSSRWASYKAGIVATAKLYTLIALVLLLVAIYEGIEVIYLFPAITQ